MLQEPLKRAATEANLIETRAAGASARRVLRSFVLIMPLAPSTCVRFDVLDEGSQLRHDLVPARMIEEDARSKRRKGCEHALQRAFGY